MKCSICNNEVLTHDSHHIIPQEYGGEDKHRYPICPTCHHTIHRCVSDPSKKDTFINMLPPEGKQLAIFMLSVLENLKGNEYKRDFVTSFIKIPRQTHEKLKIQANSFKVSLHELIIKILDSSVR